MIFGVANKRSIAWACAAACAEQGAKMAFTYQGERLKENVEKLLQRSDALLGEVKKYLPLADRLQRIVRIFGSDAAHSARPAMRAVSSGDCFDC